MFVVCPLAVSVTGSVFSRAVPLGALLAPCKDMLQTCGAFKKDFATDTGRCFVDGFWLATPCPSQLRQAQEKLVESNRPSLLCPTDVASKEGKHAMKHFNPEVASLWSFYTL